MNLYTFFICKADGVSTVLDVRELPSDAMVSDHAALMLREHACAYVSAWCGDRVVLTRYREPLGPHPLPAANDHFAPH